MVADMPARHPWKGLAIRQCTAADHGMSLNVLCTLDHEAMLVAVHCPPLRGNAMPPVIPCILLAVTSPHVRRSD